MQFTHDDCPFKAEMDAVRKLLYGNGDEGLRARLARMEERISQIREDILEIKEKEFRQMESRLRWTLAIFAAIASVVGSALVKLIWEVWK